MTQYSASGRSRVLEFRCFVRTDLLIALAELGQDRSRYCMGAGARTARRNALAIPGRLLPRELTTTGLEGIRHLKRHIAGLGPPNPHTARSMLSGSHPSRRSKSYLPAVVEKDPRQVGSFYRGQRVERLRRRARRAGKFRVMENPLPQSAAAIGHEKVQRRTADVITDERGFVAREEGEGCIDIIGRFRQDTHRLQIIGSHRKTIASEHNSAIDASCGLEDIGDFAGQAYPLGGGMECWMHKGQDIVAERCEIGAGEIHSSCLDEGAPKDLCRD